LRFSKSRVGTFHNCRLQFKYKYLDGIDDKVITDDTQFGSMVHRVAELYNPASPNWKELVKVVSEYPLQSEEYKKLIPTTLQNLKHFFLKYGSLSAEAETPLEYQDEFVHVHGIVDRKMVDGDILYIADYKTSRNVSTQYHIFQMKLYTYMAHKVWGFPVKNIRIVMYYPRPAKFDYARFTAHQMDEFETELRKELKEIEENTNWDPTPGFHCKWCPFNKTAKCSATA